MQIRFSMVVFVFLFTLVGYSASINDMFRQAEPLIFNGAQISSVLTNVNNKNTVQVALGDMDNDDDLDLIMFERYDDGHTSHGSFCFIENIGTPEAYEFKTRSWYNIVSVSSY